MRTLITVLLITLSSLLVHSQDSTAMLGHFKLDGNAKEAGGRVKAGRMQGVKPATDRFGNPGKACSLSYDFKTGKRSSISIPLDLNPKSHPLLTITFWIGMNTSSVPSGILYIADKDWSGEDHYRGIYAAREDGYMRWTACCGSDGNEHGPDILAKNWTFIALVYDQNDQAMRMVVNDQVYAGPAKMRQGAKFLRIGPFDGQIDDLSVWPRVLTLEELEKIYGKPITKDTADYHIVKRSDYKGRMEREKLERVKPNTTYIVSEAKFPIHDSAGSYNVIAMLAKDDTFTVVRVEKKSALVRLADGKEGYASVSSINGDAYEKGTSYLVHEMKSILGNIFNFTTWRNWFIAVFFAILLYFVVKKYDVIDRMLNRIGRRDPMLQGGSKSDGGSSGSILSKVFPLKRLRWWPLTTGVILALTVFIALLWNSHETEWFLNDGFRLIPTGFTRSIHWFLYVSIMTVCFMYLVMILESFVVVGPVMALPRIIILTLLMCMAILVTFYLSVLVLIIAIVMLVLTVLSAAGSNTQYKCPHCGRTFSSGAGSSGTCPHCGGGVRT